jgi:DNA-3-methyladenine glycosylase II
MVARMNPEAIRHLQRIDPLFRPVIRATKSEPFALQPRRTPFESLVNAVAHQQLTGRVAQVILARFKKLYPKTRFPSPTQVRRTSVATLRSVGFSNAKAEAIRDIAAKSLDGTIPTSRAIAKLSDDEIIERLTSARGVGPWTVQMFKLGRPDVLPADDFGVRKGFMLMHKLPELPKSKDLLAYGERWRPHRTAAAWFLWRAVEVYGKRK